MKKLTYHVSIREYASLHTYHTVHSSFIESELQTAEEVKKEILEYHKKKGVHVLDVTVTGPHDLNRSPNQK